MTKACKEFIARLGRPAVPTTYWTCKRCDKERPFSLETHLRLVGDDSMIVCSKCAMELDQNNDKSERSERHDQT